MVVVADFFDDGDHGNVHVYTAELWKANGGPSFVGDNQYGNVAPRHNEGANVGCADRHAKWIRLTNLNYQELWDRD